MPSYRIDFQNATWRIPAGDYHVPPLGASEAIPKQGTRILLGGRVPVLVMAISLGSSIRVSKPGTVSSWDIPIRILTGGSWYPLDNQEDAP